MSRDINRRPTGRSTTMQMILVSLALVSDKDIEVSINGTSWINLKMIVSRYTDILNQENAKLEFDDSDKKITIRNSKNFVTTIACIL